MKYLSILRIIVTLIPVIYDLVKQLEEIADYEGTGQEKLKLVLDVLKEAFTSDEWASAEPMLRTVIEAILKMVRKEA